MSAIGTAYLAPRTAVPQLIEAADFYYEELQTLAREIATFSWSGEVLFALLPILRRDFGLDLCSSEKAWTSELCASTGSYFVILTDADKEAFLARLDPASFDPGQLRAAFEAFNAIKAPMAEQFMPAGIAFLRDALQQVTPDDLLILVVG